MYACADMALTGLQDSSEALGLVLDGAMGTGLKPPVVMLGATLPSGFAAEVARRVSMQPFIACRDCIEAAATKLHTGHAS